MSDNTLSDNLSLQALFVIGPQRTGTTWLYEQFKAQSECVFIDRVEKESYLFLSGHEQQRTRRQVLRRATGHGSQGTVVDVCSAYFGDKPALERIHQSFPKARVVFIRRDSGERQASFESHKDFNRFGRAALGYIASDELFEKQCDFAKNEGDAFDVFGEENCLRLEFSDLSPDGGQKWIDAINDFAGTDLQLHDLGQVNAARSDRPVRTRFLYGAARFVQRTRVHVTVGRTRLLWDQRRRSPSERLRRSSELA